VLKLKNIYPEEIIEFCLDRLADFKVPRYIEYCDQDFPRTPTGKIQKLKILSEKEDLNEGCFDRTAT
jgi:acyl-CoA synthetase (AMP-forming)/AMP-acid ligase II